MFPDLVVFWEPCVSPHKIFLIEQFANLVADRCRVIHVADKDIPQERKNMGWMVDSNNLKFDNFVSPGNLEIDGIIGLADKSKFALHIFSGIHWVKLIKYAMRRVMILNHKFFLMSEPRDFDGFYGALRLFHSAITEYSIRRKCSGVLAIGSHGRRWFEMAGYNKNIIFTYGYFVPAPIVIKNNISANRDTINIGYVGRIAKEKGVGILINALSTASFKYGLTIIGTGPEEENLKILANKLNVKVDWVGVCGISEVYDYISEFDVFVLPSISKNDGWGVVVSEAVLCGVGVIVSSQAGSSLVADENILGYVFNSGDKNHLLKTLEKFINNKMHDNKNKINRAKLAKNKFSDIAGANYLEKIIMHVFCGGKRPNIFGE